MNEILDKYKSAWQKRSQALSKTKQLNREQIMDFITHQSRQVITAYRKGLLLDILFKSLLALSFLILAFLFKADANQIVLNVVLMLFTMGVLLLQAAYYRKAGFAENPGDSILDFLKAKIAFFEKELIKVLYLAALSSPIFFISGSLFYFYFKYGMIRVLDMQDYMVLGTGLVLSFVLSAIAQIKQYRFQLDQLRACLEDLDEEQIRAITLSKQRNLRLLFYFFWGGLFILILLAILHIFT